MTIRIEAPQQEPRWIDADQRLSLSAFLAAESDRIATIELSGDHEAVLAQSRQVQLRPGPNRVVFERAFSAARWPEEQEVVILQLRVDGELALQHEEHAGAGGALAAGR